jgi:hypothetical protein
MDGLIRVLAGRLKAAFALHAALAAEADVARLDAERRADLLRQAERMEAEGLAQPAQALRRCVDRMDAPAEGGVGGLEVPALAAPAAKEPERKKAR